MKEMLARNIEITAEECLVKHFKDFIPTGTIMDVIFTDSSFEMEGIILPVLSDKKGHEVDILFSK